MQMQCYQILTIHEHRVKFWNENVNVNLIHFINVEISVSKLFSQVPSFTFYINGNCIPSLRANRGQLWKDKQNKNSKKSKWKAIMPFIFYYKIVKVLSDHNNDKLGAGVTRRPPSRRLANWSTSWPCRPVDWIYSPFDQLTVDELTVDQLACRRDGGRRVTPAPICSSFAFKYWPKVTESGKPSSF